MNETPSRPQRQSTWLVIALIVAVIAIPFLLQPRHPVARPGAGGSENAQTPNPAIASKSGKIVMLDFYTDWCGYCKKMDEEVYPQPNVHKAMKDFEFRKVNAQEGDANRALATWYKVEGYPTIVFVDAKGIEIDRIVGYEPAPQFARDLTRISDKAKGK